MKLPELVLLLAFEKSRKVGFALWLFIVAGIFLFKGMIDSDKWMLCTAAVTALVGGGTIADTWLKSNAPKKDAPTPGA